MRDAVFVLLGVVLTLVLQLLAGRQTKRREREQRLFDTRRQLYAKAVREIAWRIPALVNDAIEDVEIREMETDVTAELQLLGSQRAISAWHAVLDPLEEMNLSHELPADAPDEHQATEYLEGLKDQLAGALRADLGVDPQNTYWQRLRQRIEIVRGRRRSRRLGFR